MDRNTLIAMLRDMLLARAFEERKARDYIRLPGNTGGKRQPRSIRNDARH